MAAKDLTCHTPLPSEHKDWCAQELYCHLDLYFSLMRPPTCHALGIVVAQILQGGCACQVIQMAFAVAMVWHSGVVLEARVILMGLAVHTVAHQIQWVAEMCVWTLAQRADSSNLVVLAIRSLHRVSMQMEGCCLLKHLGRQAQCRIDWMATSSYFTLIHQSDLAWGISR